MDFKIGEKIKHVFEAKDLKLKDFAHRIGLARQNVYRIFEKDSIDTDLLIKISEVLAHDFFQYYSKNTLDPRDADLMQRSGELQKQNDQLKTELMLANKEIDYLKKIIELMEERTKLLFAKK